MALQKKKIELYWIYMIISMMAYAYLQTYFWGKILSTRVYILKRIEIEARPLHLMRYGWDIK